MTTTQALIQQLNNLNSIQLDSLDSVLDCIQTPLEWFTSLNDSQQLMILRDSAWKKHVWKVFHDILPYWQLSLTRPPLFSTLWLESASPEIAITMIKTSLPVLLESLSDQHSLDTIEFYTAALKRLVIVAFPFYQYLERDQIAFVCSLLCSIPPRLANLLGSFDSDVFYIQWAHLIAQYPCTFSGELLGKLCRQGHQDKVMPRLLSAIVDPTPFPILFKHASTLVSADKIIQSLLEHVKHPHQLSSLLFSDLNEFLTCALIRLDKWSLANEQLARLAVAAAVHAGLEDLEPITEKVINTWSDSIFIKHASRHEKEYVTVGMLVLLGYAQNLRMGNLVKSVSFYFDQGDRATAQLGALVAEAVSSKLDKEPLNTGLLEGEPKLLEWKKIIFNAKEMAPLEPKELVKIDPLLEVESEEEELDPDATYIPQESDDEFQAYAMDEESDDEGNKRESDAKNHKKPAFIRDLVRYLQDKEDPVKLEIGLNAAENMIRQSTGNGTELEESSEELAKHLICFPETYELDNFRTLQREALIALIASVPEKVTNHVIDLMYDRNTSAGQSQVILSSITLAVRELAGCEAEAKQEPIQDLTDRLGTSLFVSKRIQVEKNKKKAVKNRLAGLAGPVFFFPLLVGWWEGAQGHKKHWIGNNSLLNERFIMTLNIIMHCSTNTPDKRSIVREYFEFALSMRYSNVTCKKALLLGIQVIVLESYKDQEALLFQDFLQELKETKDWLDGK
ncbi:telomere binding protein [Rhizopus stolonifer]|uniref:Telomere binding protein n=1 Tax=Rhizopus stolonifer TaxID=4846 RepID=A0A367KRK2_RHIST|nr:telomere binding protein [Rhizopus stolonifer]